MIPIDDTVLYEIAPRFTGAHASSQTRIVGDVGPVLQPTLAAYEIETRLRIAHFLAQTGHESAGFRTTEEFASGEAYEGRRDLGYIKRGDGRRYKGRGLLQLTGRDNYRDYGEALGVDLERHPTMAAEPELSLKIACEYWKRRQINADSDRDDLEAVTRKVNGGTNGIRDRARYLAKAKTTLARIEAVALSGATADNNRPVLRRGSRGGDVAELQRLLRGLDFPLAVDRDFGPATETAILQFQNARSLPADGLVGPLTWDALAAQAEAA